MPVDEDTDLEVVVLSQNKHFWRTLDAAYKRCEKEGWVASEDLD